MSHPKIVVRKHLNADALFDQVHTEFENIPDVCDSEVKISVADALTSGFAMCSLKDPSLLAFDQRRQDDTKLNNLKTISHIGVVPCDTPNAGDFRSGRHGGGGTCVFRYFSSGTPRKRPGNVDVYGQLFPSVAG